MCVAKKNDDFFLEKKAWSIVKDELLGCYFKPYVSKILHTNRPLVYVDCFAGKGKFADGNNGSPLIALETIDQCCASTSVQRPRIEATFIDLNYADDLRENLSAYPWVKIVSGKYEDNIKAIFNFPIEIKKCMVNCCIVKKTLDLRLIVYKGTH